jgi:hypothetical protein
VELKDVEKFEMLKGLLNVFAFDFSRQFSAT